MKEADSTPGSDSAPQPAEFADEPVGKPSQTAATQQKRSVHVSVTREQILASAYSGPIPPPDVLRDYEAVFPGCAERIVAMAERQSAHRQDIESTLMRSHAVVERRGQLSAFIIAMFAIAVGAYLIHIDKDVKGLIAIVSALAALVVPFLYGKHLQSQEREKKRRPFEERESKIKQLNLFDDEPNREG